MSSSAKGTDNLESVTEIARGAKAAARLLALLPADLRDAALRAAADAIGNRASEILSANRRDCDVAAHALETGQMSRSLFKRLQTSQQGIAAMSLGVRDVAALPDPLGRQLAATELDDDLTLYKESCPLGVIGI